MDETPEDYRPVTRDFSEAQLGKSRITENKLTIARKIVLDEYLCNPLEVVLNGMTESGNEQEWEFIHHSMYNIASKCLGWDMEE